MISPTTWISSKAFSTWNLTLAKPSSAPLFFVKYTSYFGSSNIPCFPGSAALHAISTTLIFKVSADFCANFRSHFALGELGRYVCIYQRTYIRFSIKMLHREQLYKCTKLQQCLLNFGENVLLNFDLMPISLQFCFKIIKILPKIVWGGIFFYPFWIHGTLLHWIK